MMHSCSKWRHKSRRVCIFCTNEWLVTVKADCGKEFFWEKNERTRSISKFGKDRQVFFSLLFSPSNLRTGKIARTHGLAAVKLHGFVRVSSTNTKKKEGRGAVRSSEKIEFTALFDCLSFWTWWLLDNASRFLIDFSELVPALLVGEVCLTALSIFVRLRCLSTEGGNTFVHFIDSCTAASLRLYVRRCLLNHAWCHLYSSSLTPSFPGDSERSFWISRSMLCSGLAHCPCLEHRVLG